MLVDMRSRAVVQRDKTSTSKTMTPAQFELHEKLEDSHWWFVGRRHVVQKIVDSVVLAGKEKILVDLGCGTGGNVGIFEGKFTCAGFDISEEAIAIARKKYKTVSFNCGSLGNSAYSVINKADVCLLLDVLEHIENDFEFLMDVFDKMKVGAHLLVTVPADMSLWSPQDEFHGHYRRYSRDQLIDIFQNLPVLVRLLSYYNSFLYPVIRTVRVLTRLRGKPWGEAGTDLSLPVEPVNFLLTKLFASESRWLLNLMDQSGRTLAPFGVSLIALLRKV